MLRVLVALRNNWQESNRRQPEIEVVGRGRPGFMINIALWFKFLWFNFNLNSEFHDLDRTFILFMLLLWFLPLSAPSAYYRRREIVASSSPMRRTDLSEFDFHSFDLYYNRRKICRQHLHTDCVDYHQRIKHQNFLATSLRGDLNAPAARGKTLSLTKTSANNTSLGACEFKLLNVFILLLPELPGMRWFWGDLCRN
jgi:hypothetical protein